MTPATTPAPVTPPAPPPAPARKWVGLNLTGIGATNREYPFMDWVKFARKFGTAANTFDSKAPVDADGNPTDDFGLFWDQLRDVNGDLQVIAQGKVTFKAFSSSISKPIYNAATDTTTATLTFNQPAGKVFAPGVAVYTGHRGCKSIQVLRNANKHDSKFSDDFVEALDGEFRCLRFMDWAATNFSQQKTWSDRPNLTDAQWSIKGVPWEVCIDLCNLLGANGWFNVPCMANDDYVANMLALINSRLHPSLTPIIEFSNEIWNGGTFGGSTGQFTQNASATLAEIAAGDRTLSLPSDPAGGIYAQYRRVAKRSYQIQQIAEKIAPGRFKVVLPIGVNAGWQMLTKMLDWTRANAGKPSDIFASVAVAPYFSEGKTLAAQADATVDQLLDGFEAGIAGAVENLPDVLHVCAREGLGLWCYEMGADAKQVNVNVANKIAAMESPRMGQITSDFLYWVYQHADGGCFFSDANAYDKNNMFGLRQHVREIYTPKYLAVKAFMRGMAIR